MGTDSEQRQDAHNDGEKDCENHYADDSWNLWPDYYQPPSDPELREAYKNGWENVENRKFS